VCQSDEAMSFPGFSRVSESFNLRASNAHFERYKISVSTDTDYIELPQGFLTLRNERFFNAVIFASGLLPAAAIVLPALHGRRLRFCREPVGRIWRSR
jgi:hypothetical protein